MMDPFRLLLLLLLSAGRLALSASFFDGVPFVIILDINRFEDKAVNYHDAQALSEELGMVGGRSITRVTTKEEKKTPYEVPSDRLDVDGVFVCSAIFHNPSRGLSIVTWRAFGNSGQHSGSFDRHVDAADASLAHAHLRALLLAYLLPHLDYVVIVESGVSITELPQCAASHSIASLVAALPSEDWSMLQLTSTTPAGGPAYALQEQLPHYRKGYHLKPRDACGVDASVLREAQAYAVHRRGMEDILSQYIEDLPAVVDRWYGGKMGRGGSPPSSPPAVASFIKRYVSEQPVRGSTWDLRDGSSLSTDLLLFDRPHVYTTTCPMLYPHRRATRRPWEVQLDRLYREAAAHAPRSDAIVQQGKEGEEKDSSGIAPLLLAPMEGQPWDHYETVLALSPTCFTTMDNKTLLHAHGGDEKDDDLFEAAARRLCSCFSSSSSSQSQQRALPSSSSSSCTDRLVMLLDAWNDTCTTTTTAPGGSEERGGGGERRRAGDHDDADDGGIRAVRLVFLHDSHLVSLTWPLNTSHPEVAEVAARRYCQPQEVVVMQEGRGAMLDCESLVTMAHLAQASAALNRAVAERRRLPHPHHHHLPTPPASTAKRSAAAAGGEAPPVAVFFHVATIGTMWQTITSDMLLGLEQAGLATVADEVHIGLLGEGAALPPSTTNPSFRVTPLGSDLKRYEFPTLDLLTTYCQRQPDARVLYLHNKGSSLTLPKGADRCLHTLEWRRMMEHFMVERYQECLAALHHHHDTCGVSYRPLPSPHYSGNFWWARCSYINTLPPISSLDQTSRFAAEDWVLSSPSLPSSSSPSWRTIKEGGGAVSCYNVTFDQYLQVIGEERREQYRQAPGCSAYVRLVREGAGGATTTTTTVPLMQRPEELEANIMR